MGSGGLSIWQLLMVLVYVAVLVLLFKSIRKDAKKNMICSRCGTQARSKTHTRGSILIEILLWLLFIIPGLIYSIWRLTTRGKVCAVCGAAELVPVNSPAGKELLARYGQTHEHGSKPVSRPANTGYSITGAENSPASTRSGTRPTGTPKPSGGRRE